MSKRLRFLLGHLFISLTVVIISLILFFFVWYPAPLADATGVTHLIWMLIIIDVFIGPLFGWLVYKEGKKSLKFDLSVVIAIQVSAFVYGFYTIEQGRPTWIVYDAFAFHLVKKSDIETTHLDLAQPKFKSPSWLQPEFVALKDQKARAEVSPLPRASLPIDHPMYYEDLKDAEVRVKSVARSLELLHDYNDKQKVDSILQKYPQADSWLPLSSPEKNLVVLINKSNLEVIKIVDLEPFAGKIFK